MARRRGARLALGLVSRESIYVVLPGNDLRVMEVVDDRAHVLPVFKFFLAFKLKCAFGGFFKGDSDHGSMHSSIALRS